MHFLRKTLVWLATAALPLWLFLMATTASIVLTFHSPAKIKVWVNNSGVYNNVVDAVLTQSQKSSQKSGDSLPISDPHVQAAAKKAFSPTVLQGYTENVIDGMYHWLQGKTPQPDFRIDLSRPKKQFAATIGAYLGDRIKHLPACATGQIPRYSDDLFRITCRPAGINLEAQVQQQVNKLAHSKEFLGDPVITANDLKTSDGKPLFTTHREGSVGKLDAAPNVYKRATASPWLLGIIAAIGVAIIVFLHDSRRKGLKHAAWVLLPTGALLTLIGIGILQATSRLEAKIHLKGAGAKLQPAVVSLINNVTGSLGHTYLWFGVGYALIGIGLLVSVKLWIKPQKAAAPEPAPTSDKKPEKTDTPKSA